MKIDLREYQDDAIEQARQAIRNGAKNVLICAPTGGGKTVIASALIEANQSKGRRSAFVVDRKSLIEQTSSTFDRYGIEHGVIQADHPRFRPSRPTQLCSIQTIARRRWPDADLIVVDEAHTVTETVKKRIEPRDTITVGLTATPFTKGLGKLYDAIVNVTTTNRLIEQGFLSKYRIFACVEPNMEGVKVVAGEWEKDETQKRALQVVGDVVQEYLKHGEDRKFICSAVDTAHVEELQRQFLSAGINVATYTYKDEDEDRAETLVEYRRPDSKIRGLITVTAASKGFDVADIGCVIMARPLRKSLAEHIQFFGRGLRIAEGKTDCVILDHSGNCERFWADMQEFFELGVTELDDGKKKEKPKAKEKTEPEPVRCPQCRHMHKPAPFCPSCGHEYPKRAAVEHVPGTLKELIATKDAGMLRKQLWPQICWYVREHRNPSDDLHAQRIAQGIYASMVGEPARARYETTEPKKCSHELLSKLQGERQRYLIAQREAKRKEAGRQPVAAA